MDGNNISPKNVILIKGPFSGVIRDVYDVINVDTTLGPVDLYLQNIKQSNLLYASRCVYINDVGNNLSVNNLTLFGSLGDIVNNTASIVVSSNGANLKCSVATQNEWTVSGLTSSGGGSVTGADNGLTLVGTVIKLGGSLIAPTTIDASSNPLIITDSWGIMFTSRDANGNFTINRLSSSALPLTNSQYIFAYASDAGTSFTDSLIAYHWGGQAVYNNATDTWNFGDYTRLTNTGNTYNLGRANSFNNTQDVVSFGSYNTVANSYGVTVIGQGNNILNLNNQFILGNNNNNLIVDAVSGNVLTLPTYNDLTSFGTTKLVGIDSLGKLYNTGIDPLNLFTLVDNGLHISVSTVKLGGALTETTTIAASNNNRLTITDDFGIVLESRDYLRNLIIAATGTPTFANSYDIYTYRSDATTAFINSSDIIHFGIDSVYTGSSDIYNFGNYTHITSSAGISVTGRYNYIDSSSTIFILGANNNLTATSDVTIIGHNNLFTGISNKIIIGSYNQNFIIDRNTGSLNSTPTFNTTTNSGIGRIVGVDSLGDIYNTNIDPLTIFNLFTGASCASDIYVSNIHSCSPLHIQPTNTGDVYIVENGGKVGIGTTNPTFKLSVGTSIDGDGFLLTDASSNPLIGIQKSGNGGYLGIYKGGVNTVLIGDNIYNGADFINTGRKLGIGTTNAGFKLTVSTSVDTDGMFLTDNLGNPLGGIQKSGVGGYLGLYNNSAATVILGTYSGLANSFINDGKNLGIGTSSPTSKLHIKGISSTSTDFALKVDNLSNTPLLYVRNDGQVLVNGLTLGLGGGLVSTNTVFGWMALANNVTGNYNVAIGYESGINSTGNGNNYVGYRSGISVTNSTDNCFFGLLSGAGALGSGNTFLGSRAGAGNNSSVFNVGVGYNALAGNLSGSENIALGTNALGGGAGLTGDSNVALGFYSMLNSTNAFCNVAVGKFSLVYNTTGDYNVAIGYNAARNQTTASNKLFIDNQDRGDAATELTNSLIVGTFDSVVASQYLRFNANVGIGVDAAAKLHIKGIDASSNYALKVDNLSNTHLLYVRNDGFTTIMNMIVGRGGGLIASNTVLGVSSLIANSTGSGNVAVGFSTLSSNTTGSLNVAIGHNSSVNNTIGNNNVGVGYASNFSLIDGSGNVGIGSSANSSNQSGSHNIALGFSSLYTNTSNFNVGIGVFSGTNNLGTRNIFLGSYSGTNQTVVSNLLIIDNQDRGSAANELINSLIVGNFAATSAGQTLRFNANVGFNGMSFGGGVGVLFKGFAATVPTTNPIGGVIDYVENTGSGVQKYRDTNGTIIAY